MGASTFIPLERVWAMLKACLSVGWTSRPTAHNHRIFLEDGRIYPSLPLGEHGHRRDAEVKAGHVRNLARQLGIEECARREIPEAFS